MAKATCGNQNQSDEPKPLCEACGSEVQEHRAPIDPTASYFCSQKKCEKAREQLDRDIQGVFDDYENDFLEHEQAAELAEQEAGSVAAAKAIDLQRGLLVQKGHTLYRKLKREWPDATDEAILSVTIEKARKAKPPLWADLIGGSHKADVPPRESELRFQMYAQDSVQWNVGGATGTDHIPGAIGNVSRVTQDTSGSLKESENRGWEVLDTGDVCRKDTPEWIRDQNQLEEFFESRSAKAIQIRSSGITRAWSHGCALDQVILQEYYLGRLSDQQIFDAYKEQFDLERQLKLGKVRWTSSADAVKHRRVRLLCERDALIGKAKKWTDDSWRGIIVWYAAENRDHQRCWTRAGIATKKRRQSALTIAEDMGYAGRFAGDLADLVADETFDNYGALEVWMEGHGLCSRDKAQKAVLAMASK